MITRPSFGLTRILGAALLATALSCSGKADDDDGDDDGDDGSTATEDCTDGIDNDGDGYVDCIDFDCEEFCADFEAEGSADASECSDGEDNDGDGRTDCEQNTCWRNWDATTCVEETEDECSDGIDNDDDGNGADCDDPDCGFSLACGGSGTPEATNETCSDGEDNDGDTYTDCDDWSCQYTTSVTVCD